MSSLSREKYSGEGSRSDTGKTLDSLHSGKMSLCQTQRQIGQHFVHRRLAPKVREPGSRGTVIPMSRRSPQPSARLLVLVATTLVALLGSPGAVRAADDPVGSWPLEPRPQVIGRFDPPDDPWGSGHRGVDLGGRVAQPVRSALPGRVAFAGRIAGRGVVVVSHGDTRTTYEPVTAVVAPGDAVAAGDVVGHLELVGSHCFPRACLHWGWLRDETYLDPLRLVGGGPVRLLPLWQDRGLTPVGGLADRPFGVGRW